MASSDKVRVTITFSKKAREKADEIRRKAGLPNLTALIKQSIELYAYLNRAQRQGKRIILDPKKGDMLEVLKFA
jgi:hypothetical protein